MADISIRVLGLDGKWSVFGTEQGRGVWPENVSLTSDTKGSLSASFTLRRDPHLPWSDLAALSPIEVSVGGQLCWKGRLKETPLTLGSDASISVNCEGRQAVMDDNFLRRNFLMQGGPRAVDSTTLSLTAGLGFLTQKGNVGVGRMPVLAFPPGVALVAGDAVGVTIDFGASDYLSLDDTFRQLTAAWTYNLTTPANWLLFARLSPSPDIGTAGYTDLYAAAQPAASGSNNGSWTGATAQRYLHLFLMANATFTTPATPQWVRFTQISMYRDPAFNPLLASAVIADTVALVGGTWWGLSPDTSQISATVTALGEFAPDQSLTLSEIISALNAYHDYLWGVDLYDRVYFKPRPTTAVVEVGDWSGWEFKDASAGVGDALYNWAQVENTGPDGKTQVRNVNVATPALDRLVLSRTKLLPIDAALPAADLITLGQVWLNNNNRTQLRGSVSVSGHGAVRTVLGGSKLHPADLLTLPGQMIRLPIVDPDTGAFTRDGIIAAVTYDHDTESASISIDSERDRFEPLLQRMGLLASTYGLGVS